MSHDSDEQERPAEESGPARGSASSSKASHADTIVVGGLRISAVSISLGALVVSAAVGFLSLYLPYRVDHDLELTICGFDPDPFSGLIGVGLICSNRGNQYESILSASFTLPAGTATESTFWLDVPRVVLTPVVLAPGETTYRYLEQPMDHTDLIEMQKLNAGGHTFNDPDHQLIALEVVVRGKRGLPRTHRIMVARAETKGDRAGPWEFFGTESRDLPGGLIKVDLLDGGKAGLPFRGHTDVQYSAGGRPEAVVPWPRPSVGDSLPN